MTASHLSNQVAFMSPTYKIGKTDWRIIVYVGESFNFKTGKYEPCRFTHYQFEDLSQYWRGDKWMDENEHPRYKSDDGTWAGLPHGLRKIYQNHEAEIKAALEAQ